MYCVFRAPTRSPIHVLSRQYPAARADAPLKILQVREDLAQARLLEAHPLTNRIPQALPARGRDHSPPPRAELMVGAQRARVLPMDDAAPDLPSHHKRVPAPDLPA